MSGQLSPIPNTQALTIIDSGARSETQPRKAIRTEIGFLAQLVAAQAGAIQQRTRRRETPGHAIAAYTAAHAPRGVSSVTLAA